MKKKTFISRADLPILLLATLLLISAGGFAAFYYFDRYVHPDEKVLARQSKHLEGMVQKNPQNPDMRVATAVYYLDSGLVDAAIQQGEEALKIEPKHQGAMILLGRAYETKGNNEKAVEYMTQVIELNRDNPMAKVDKRINTVYYHLGTLYRQQGKYPEASEALKNALNIDYTDADARYALGTVYQKQNDHAAAIKEFQEALRFDPTYGDPYQGLAASYAALGDHTKAAYARAMVTLTQGKYGDAATQLEAVVGQSPDLAQANFGLGLAYEKLGKRPEAIAALNSFLKVYPNDIAARQALGRLEQGN
ncbi:Cellulose synthase operon protein C [Anaerolineae bacterium]|nr:Cellulose synthase operon protein C [Anaerolineae bacterium]